MLNMAVNNISYQLHPLSTRIEKGFTTKILFFFFIQYVKVVLFWYIHFEKMHEIGIKKYIFGL